MPSMSSPQQTAYSSGQNSPVLQNQPSSNQQANFFQAPPSPMMQHAPQPNNNFFADPSNTRVTDSTGLNFDFKDKIQDSTYQGASLLQSNNVQMTSNGTFFPGTTTISKLVDAKYTNVKYNTGLSAIPSVEEGYSQHLNTSVVSPANASGRETI